MLKAFDMKQFGGGVSIAAGTNTDLTDEEGSYVEAADTVGPVHALCSAGAITGSPTSMSLKFEMWEADDSSGTNAQICADQTKPTLTAASTQGFLSAQTSKPYVKVRIEGDDSAFVGGSSPTVDVFAGVLYSQSNA